MEKEKAICAQSSDAGFSLIEICLVLMLMCIIGGFAVLSVFEIMPGIKANEAMYQMVGQLRNARETAIGQRRTIEVRFLDANRIQLVRYNLPNGTTTLSDIQFANGCEFQLFGNIPDTPDRFGNAAAVNFPGADSLKFLSDGTLVDDDNNPISGSVYLGVPGRPETARAVTILGATGRVRSYRWTGTEWVQ
jgi:Tfp pilus assembly protein FimT